ncbi:50S ribosomal protein L20 [Acidobacteriota bacterium]
MSRVKRSYRRKERRHKILKLAKGYYGAKSRLYRIAKQAVERSLLYSYRDRRNKKREFRRLWITRINAACRENDLTYGGFIHGLKQGGVEINRKVLADIAVRDPEGFRSLVDQVKAEA